MWVEETLIRQLRSASKCGVGHDRSKRRSEEEKRGINDSETDVDERRING
jgi:hypothetical protein